MKTHFTQADIGKTFATSQQGVTATILEYDNQDNTLRVQYSNMDYPVWASNEGVCYPPNPDIYHSSIPSEADLLRKEIEEVYDLINKLQEQYDENGYSCTPFIKLLRVKSCVDSVIKHYFDTEQSLRKEIAKLKASHEADLRTAVEMARELISFEEYDNDWLYEPDEIIEKILKKPD